MIYHILKLNINLKKVFTKIYFQKKPFKIFINKYKEWEEDKKKAEEDYINSFNNYYDILMNYSKEIEGNLEIIFDNN